MPQRISRSPRRPIALKVTLNPLLAQVRREGRFAAGPAGLGEIPHRQVPAMVVGPHPARRGGAIINLYFLKSMPYWDGTQTAISCAGR